MSRSPDQVMASADEARTPGMPLIVSERDGIVQPLPLRSGQHGQHRGEVGFVFAACSFGL
jgi:hypothetical protein